MHRSRSGDKQTGRHKPCTLTDTPQVFLTPQYLGIVMEFAPGGDMFEYVVKKNGLREDEARWFFQQLIVGLDYCHKRVRGQINTLHVALASKPSRRLSHSLSMRLAVLYSQGVVNRDIKLENTLLDNSPRPLVKVCDFGYSKVSEAHVRHTHTHAQDAQQHRMQRVRAVPPVCVSIRRSACNRRAVCLRMT